MDNGIKIAAWVIGGVILAWIILQVVSAIFSIVSWIVSMLVTLAVVGIVLFVAYLLLRRLMGGNGGSTVGERERIYE